MEENTICSYEEWLEFRQNEYLDDKWNAVLQSTNNTNAMLIQPQEGKHTPFILTEFTEFIKNNFIGFCLTPMFIYKSNVYTVKTVRSSKTPVEDAKKEIIDFLKGKNNLILYYVDFCSVVCSLAGQLEYSIILRYGEVEI
jgi:hypothetical protein